MSGYRRVILKLSGEALKGESGPVSKEAALALAGEVKIARDAGVEIGIVIGGGNILRGLSAGRSGSARVNADSMGMLATVINAIALRSALEELGVPAAVLSAVECGALVERYSATRAERELSAGRVAIFAGGTGNPFFSTDSAAALRAAELSADALLKGTKVDGVYDSDPAVNPSALRFDELTYMQVIEKKLAVMDMTAVSLCREQGLPIVVFALSKAGNVARAAAGEPVGSTVKEA